MIDMSDVVKVEPTSKRNDLCQPPSDCPEGMDLDTHAFLVFIHSTIASHAGHDTWHDSSGQVWPDTDWFWFERGQDAYAAGETRDPLLNAVFAEFVLYVTDGKVDLSQFVNGVRDDGGDYETHIDAPEGQAPDSFRLGWDMAAILTPLGAPSA